jgi:SAM-dependent methyltransferase
MARPDPVAFGSSATAWAEYAPYLSELLERHQPRAVCELGAGANPAIGLEEVARRRLEYTLVDVSADELAKAPAGYRTRQADLCDPTLDLEERYDFVFSRMLLEHVRDGEQFHRNVRRMLRPGGVAFHFFPTLFSPVFVANRLLKAAWTTHLLDALAPRDPLREKKFAAYYSWCRGPTAGQVLRLESLGYEVLTYRGFFGHNYYARVPVVRAAHRVATRFLLRHPLAHLTSYAYLLLRKKPRALAPAGPAAAPRSASRAAGDLAVG